MNNMTTETMKETTRKVLGTAALFIGSFCVMGCVETPVKAQPSAAPSGLVDLTQAAETSVNAVVYIKVTTNSKTKTVDVQDPFSDFFGDFFGFGGGGRQQRQIQTPKREGSGSGVIISSDGYIVTNNHVVSEADELLVKLNDNREFKGRIIGTDEQTDLALIKIEGKDFPTLPIGNSDDLKLGEWVLAVGNPFNLTSTVTAGIVSAKARSMGANSIESFIQTDAAINPGNSGGALLNANGEVIGINSAKIATETVEGIGYAIPVSDVSDLITNLMNQKTKTKVAESERGYIGIKGVDVTADSAQMYNMPTGVYVSEVISGGGAEKAGITKGAVITGIEGTSVDGMDALQEQLQYYKAGEKVKITVQTQSKNGEYEKKDVEVTLGKQSE